MLMPNLQQLTLALQKKQGIRLPRRLGRLQGMEVMQQVVFYG
jgi:hypothetical protein